MSFQEPPHPLELAASVAMQTSADEPNIWIAMKLQDVALRIRSLPGWRGYHGTIHLPKRGQ